MPRQTRTNRMILLVFGTGAAIGLQSGLVFLLVWQSPAALLAFVALSLVYAAMTYALWRWGFPRVRARALGWEIAGQTLVAAVVFGALAVASTHLLIAAFGAPPRPLLNPALAPWLPPALRGLSVHLVPILPPMLIALIGYHQIWRRIVTLQHRERELTELAATAQLAALRAQMSPHFLFNGLNSIAQLIHVDPDKAEACVHRLAVIFRYVLRRAHEGSCPSPRSSRWSRRTSRSSGRASGTACGSRPASIRRASPSSSRTSSSSRWSRTP